jgi:hypothetical protein
MARPALTAFLLALLLAPPPAGAACPDIVAGSCWVVEGGIARGSSAASAYGRSVRCWTRCRVGGGAAIVLRDDGTYSLPPRVTPFECRDGVTIEVPVEEGTVVEKRGRLVLEPANLAALDAALDVCAGRDVVVRRYRTTLRVASDGTRLHGVAKIRTLTPGTIPVGGRAVQRFTATRAATMSAASAGLARARDLPACSPGLQPRCVID